MKILLLITAAIISLALIGIVAYNNFRADQVRVQAYVGIGPEQETYYTETPMDKLPPTPPGINSITGRPIVEPQATQIVQNQSYGTPPLQEFEPKMSEGYPYSAGLPVGTEGKIQIAYNYVITKPGQYIVNLKVTNLSNRILEKFYYNEFLRDDSGNSLYEKLDEGCQNAPPYFPLLPGGSASWDTGKVSLKGSFGTSPIETWKVKIEATYVKF